MIDIIQVGYSESRSDKSSYIVKNFVKTDRRSATNFAKSISKQNGRAHIVKSSGDYFNGIFYASKSSHIAEYIDGKKVL